MKRTPRKWEKTWNIEPGGLSRKLGLTTTEILSHAHEGGVRALYIMGENPMMSEPNLNETRKHMEQLEFLVSQDIFINEVGAFADVFLPATPFAEKDGTFSNTDRRVQRVRAAHAPRGQSRVRLADHLRLGPAPRISTWALPLQPNGIIPSPKRSCARWQAVNPGLCRRHL